MPFTDILRFMRKGSVVQVLTDRLADVCKAASETGKAGELTLKIKIKPEAVGGKQFDFVPSIGFTVPQPDLKPSVFYMTDDGGVVREDPDQAEMFPAPVEVPHRAYTPPGREVG